MGADVERLYKRGLEKETDGCPLLICIDVNLPHRDDAPSTLPSWAGDVREFLDRKPPSEEEPAKEFCLSFTNFNWHFTGIEAASRQSHIYTFPEWTASAPSKDETYAAILQAFEGYGNRPEAPY